MNEGPKLAEETQINRKAETGKNLIQNKESLETLMYKCKHLMWKLVNLHNRKWLKQGQQMKQTNRNGAAGWEYS